MNRIKSCLIAVALFAFAFSSFALALASSRDTSPPITAVDHIVRADSILSQSALAIVAPFYANAHNLEQALPIDRWRDIIAPIALAFAACAYLAKRIRYLKHQFTVHRSGFATWKLRLKLVLRSLIALAFGRPPGFATANAAPAAPPKNEMVELLSKGAGVDPADVYWRVARGLSAKQAVDVAAQEALERKVTAYSDKVKDKDDSEIRALAKKANVDPLALPDMSRQQLLIAIVRADNAKEGIPAPGETTTTPAVTAATLPDDFETMKAAELKKLAAARNVDITGLRKNDDIRAAIKAAPAA